MSDRGLVPEEEWESSPSATGTNHVLAIGIDAYKHWQSLNNAVRDCDALIDVLLRKYRFDEKQVVRLYNAEATRENIWTALGTLVKTVAPEDNVLIYYAGHGYQDDLDWGYWIPVNASKSSSAGFFKDEEVMAFIKKIKCHHLMLISDSCFSGTFFKALSRSEDSFSRDPSRWALTSGRLELVSDGKMGEGSPFNRLLVEALEENTDRLHFSKLAQQVKFGTNEVTDKKQSPLAGPLDIEENEGGEFVFMPKKDEEADWRRVLEQGTAVDFLKYLKFYPDGKYIQEAYEQLDELAWQQAMRAASIAAFRQYLKDYPQGSHVVDANAQIDELEWKAAKEKDTKGSYRYYLNTVITGKYRQEAIKAMDFCEERSVFNRAKHRESRLRQYLLDVEQGKYDGHFAEEAKELLAKMEEKPKPKPEKVPPKTSKQVPNPKEVQLESPAKQQSIPKANLEPSEKVSKTISEDASPKPFVGTQQKTKSKPKKELWIPFGIVAALLMMWGISQVNKTTYSDPIDITQIGYDNLIPMKPIKGGDFLMGSNDGDDDEKPVHKVTVSDFEMGQTEVTNAQYAAFLNEVLPGNDSLDRWISLDGSYAAEKCRITQKSNVFVVESGYEKHPVLYVSWHGANAFARWLNAHSSYTYKLSSEAQWEYAASGGIHKSAFKYAGSDEPNDVGWYTDNSGSQAHQVAQKDSNALGLYDMSGNVWEWCQDRWHSDYNDAPDDGSAWTSGNSAVRVIRGGSWFLGARSLRVSIRDRDIPDSRGGDIGFRLTRTP